jgi:hypothetical protein
MPDKARVIDAEFTVVEEHKEPVQNCRWCNTPAPDKTFWASVLSQHVPFCAPCATRIQFLCNAVPMAFNQLAKLVGHSKSGSKK